MSRSKIILKAIQRNKKHRDFNPGSCNEIINLRFKNNTWKPVGRKTLFSAIAGYPDVNIIGIHPTPQGQNIIFTSANILIAKKHDGVFQTLIPATGKISFECINNIIVISLESKIEYFAYSDNTYLHITTRFDNFQVNRFIAGISRPWNNELKDNYTMINGTRQLLTRFLPLGIDFLSRSAARADASGKIADFETLLSNVLQLKQEAQEIGIPVHNVKFIATIELFDGSEVFHTPEIETSFGDIMITRVGEAGQFSVTLRWPDDPHHSTDLRTIQYKFRLSGLPLDKSLIKNINFYISRPAPLFVNYHDDFIVNNMVHPIVAEWDMNSHIVSTPQIEFYSRFFYRPIFNESPVEKSNFYRVASIPFSTISLDGIISVKFANINNLETYQVLAPDNFSHHTITAKSAMTYNNRLFLSNITTKFPEPFPLSIQNIRFSPAPNRIAGEQPLIDFYVRLWRGQVNSPAQTPAFIVPGTGHMTTGNLFTDSRTKNTFLGNYHGHLHNLGGWRLIPQYEVIIEAYYQVFIKTPTGDIVISSPVELFKGFDMRLEQGRWVFTQPVIGRVVYPDIRAYKAIFYFRRASFHDFDANITHTSNSPYISHEFQMKSSELQNYSYCDLAIESFTEGGIVRIPAPVSIHPAIEDFNRVQVSALNNPFVFPAVNSYRVGDSAIIALHTINNQLSEGQFGDFPVIAFTASGIWAMNIGSDNLLISNIVPLANEICTNANSIMAIRRGIFFASNEGLKILQGSNILNISESLDGDIANPLKATPVFIDAMQKNTLLPALSSINFSEYIINANIGYDDYNEEIIISNPLYNYSYLYSITHQSWYKVNISFDSFSSKYPLLFGFKENEIFHLNKELPQSLPILFLTNEIDFDGIFSKLDQLICRGKFGRGRILVFGTTDFIHWRIISVMTCAPGYDIIAPRGFYTCKNFAILFDSIFDDTCFVDTIDIDSTHRYSGKLR